MNFNGQTAIVTGASMGIGLATAKQLVSLGANVIMADIKEKALCEEAEKLNVNGEKAFPYVCDVSNEDRVHEVVSDVLKKFKKIDILINNAGDFKSDNYPFSESKSAYWKHKIDVNILGTMYFAQAVLPNMLENKYGRIINLASVAAVYGLAGMVDYSMTKGAVVSFTKALAKEVTEKGVTVNAVSPGGINPDPKALAHLSFINRSGSYEECADLLCYLASEGARYISGQNYQIDGCRKKM